GSNIFAATDRNPDRIFLSSDSAKTWRSVSTGLEHASKYSNAYQLAVSDKYLFVGIIDNGVWRRPFSDFSSVKNTKESENEILLSPNPATSLLSISNAPENLPGIS